MHVESRTQSVDRRIAALAERQLGVVSREQLLRLGLGRGAIEHRLAIGRLHLVHRGVYSVGHRVLSFKGRYLAAVMACGDGAVTSHRAAGDIWGIRPTASATVQVTVLAGSNRTRRRPGILVHRTRVLRPADVTRRDSIPVTSLGRTLVDLGSTIQQHELARAVERAEALRVFDLRSVRAILDANPSRPGSAVLRAVLEDGYGDVGLTRSDLEALFLELCAKHDLPRPLVNTYVGPYEVDFLWPAQRVIVETDGHETHGTRTAFERDRARDARLQAAGYRVIRFTYRQVMRGPETLARLIREVLGIA